jgi:hypothetical protein
MWFFHGLVKMPLWINLQSIVWERKWCVLNQSKFCLHLQNLPKQNLQFVFGKIQFILFTKLNNLVSLLEKGITTMQD